MDLEPNSVDPREHKLTPRLCPRIWRARCRGRVTVANAHTVNSERDINYWMGRPPRTHGLVNVEAAGTCRWFPGDSQKMIADAYAVELVTEGRAKLSTRAGSHIVESGHVIFRHPGQRYELMACSSGVRRSYLRFAGAHASAVFATLGLDKMAALALPPTTQAEAGTLFDEVLTLMRERPPGFDRPLAIAAFKLLDLVSRTAYPEPASELPQTLQRATAYAEQHLAELRSVNALAAALAISHEHLTRLFQHHLGMAPRQWMETRRIQSACHLLAHTNARIEDIAEKTGYPDPPQFHRAFKRAAGMTPIGYRRLRRGDVPAHRATHPHTDIERPAGGRRRHGGRIRDVHK